MKLKFATSAAGQVLVTAVVTLGVVGIALGAFINLLTSNTNYTARSQSWNSCIPVAEAGIEEAMAFLNNPDSTGIQAGYGWTWNTASNAFYKSVPLGSSYYEACIYTNSAPTGVVLVAIGYVPASLTIGSGANPLAAAGVSVTPIRYLSRAIRADLYIRPMIPKGMAVKNTLDFNGNTIAIDSYDNDFGPYGTSGVNGLNIRDNAEVSTDADLDGGNQGNAKIKGRLLTGPTAKVGIGPNGSVGNSAWVDTGTKGVQSGHLRTDSNFSLPDVQSPWIVAQPSPPSGIYSYELGSGAYEINGNCNISKTSTMLVTGDARLWVKGNLNMSEFLTVTNAGARLTLFVSGNIILSGSWDTLSPEQVLVYGLPGCKMVSVTTGSNIKCSLYTPNANVAIAGNATMFGAVAATSVKMNGGTSFHCDESLGRHVPPRIYKVLSWREL